MNEIRQAADRFALLDHAPVGQFVLRQDFVALYWNRCLEAWTGIGREQMVGSSILEHYPHLGAAKYSSRITEIFRGGPPTVFSSQLHKFVIPAPLPGGKVRAQYTVVTAIPALAEKAWYALFAIQDVTSLTEAIENHRQALRHAMAEMEERKKAEADLQESAAELKRLNDILKEQSIRDGLTGLFNYRYLYQVLQRDFLLAARNGTDLAAILLDLDDFKRINDTYGHLFGDTVLKQVASLIQSAVRTTDLVARYGGEEFAILLPNTDLDGALVTAEHLRRCIEEHPFGTGSETLRITASLGVSSRWSHHPTNPQDLLAFADHALYSAKDSGRNQCHVLPIADPALGALPGPGVDHS